MIFQMLRPPFKGRHESTAGNAATTHRRVPIRREIYYRVGYYLVVVNMQLGAGQAVCAVEQERALTHLSKQW